MTTPPRREGTVARPGRLRARKDLARPEGSEHTLPTIVIDGVDELVEALRAA